MCVSFWCTTPFLESLGAPSTKNINHESYGTLFLSVQGTRQGKTHILANLRMSLEGSISLCLETLLALLVSVRLHEYPII